LQEVQTKHSLCHLDPIAEKYGPTIFLPHPAQNPPLTLSDAPEQFGQWGCPLISLNPVSTKGVLHLTQAKQ